MTFGCLTMALYLVTGCSGSAPAVAGVVRVGGEPLAEGAVSFIPEDGKGAVAGAPIKAGKYQIEKDLMVGRYWVEIHGERKTGKRILNPIFPADYVDEVVAVVPPKYNTKGNLIREVTAGFNPIDFELDPIKKSKKGGGRTENRKRNYELLVLSSPLRASGHKKRPTGAR